MDKAVDKAAFEGLAVALIRVVGAEVVGGFVPREKVVGHHQQRVRHRNGRTSLPFAGQQASVLRPHVRVLACSCVFLVRPAAWAASTSAARRHGLPLRVAADRSGRLARLCRCASPRACRSRTAWFAPRRRVSPRTSGRSHRLRRGRRDWQVAAPPGDALCRPRWRFWEAWASCALPKRARPVTVAWRSRKRTRSPSIGLPSRWGAAAFASVDCTGRPRMILVRLH